MSSWTEEQKRMRMANHARIIRDTASWPSKVLPLKSQPWVTEANGDRMTTGTIARRSVERGQPYVVSDSGIQVFDTVEELVKVWAVD
ncbi:hypothetical protein NKI86_31730 [Mesorhizobium sp. M0320]|uniref:hypothetical protein n=1 Tax=Mesorhizobium sp. M0320 TaxID=2956936 RepID=UPI003335F110